MKKQLLLIILCFIMILAPNSLKAMETPEDVLNKELIHQLTGSIGFVIGSDWFRGNEKILEIKNDKRHSDILHVKVQVVSFQGPHNPPYIEEIITFKIAGNKIKPVDYFNRVIPESEWRKFDIPTLLILNKLNTPTSTMGAADPDESLREDMEEGGYIPIDKAIDEFENLTNKKVMLPTIPFEANHKVGRISKDGFLSLEWINTKGKLSKIFKLDIKLAQNKLTFPTLEKYELIQLEDGTPAYFSDYHFYKLVFRKEDLDYRYSQGHDTTKAKFIQIAESFKYDFQ